MDSLQHFADIYSKPRSFVVDAAAADAGDGSSGDADADGNGNGNGNEAAEVAGAEEAAADEEEGGGGEAQAEAVAGEDGAGAAEAEADTQPSQDDNDVQFQQNPNLNRFLVNYPGEGPPSSPPVQSDDYYVQRQPLAKFNPFGLSLSQGIGGQPTLGSISSFGSYPSASPGAQHSSYYL